MMEEKNTFEKIIGFLLPYHRCTYKSKLTQEVILNRIRENTEPEQFFRVSSWFKNSKKTRHYEGEIGTNNFKILMISKRKNSYTPVITGEVSSSNQNTKVAIRMRLRYYFLIFMGFWFLMVSNMLYAENTIFEDFEVTNLNHWIPVLFIFVFYIITTASFHYHVIKSKKMLEQLIEPIDDFDAGASWITRN
jgi:hypothetical protein